MLLPGCPQTNPKLVPHTHFSILQQHTNRQSVQKQPPPGPKAPRPHKEHVSETEVDGRNSVIIHLLCNTLKKNTTTPEWER